jgi:hypothetical protein
LLHVFVTKPARIAKPVTDITLPSMFDHLDHWDEQSSEALFTDRLHNMGFSDTSGATATAVVKAKRCGATESARPLKRVKLVPSDILQASLVFVVNYNTKRYASYSIEACLDCTPLSFHFQPYFLVLFPK